MCEQWQLQDNASTHASHLVQRFLVKHQITQDTQPHCRPDLVPCNFWLFPKLKSPLKGKRFQTPQWDPGKYDRAADGDWENCVRSQGAYLEGDWSIIVLYTMFLVSCIFFNKCLCFSYYMAGYLLDRTHMCMLSLKLSFHQKKKKERERERERKTTWNCLECIVGILV